MMLVPQRGPAPRCPNPPATASLLPHCTDRMAPLPLPPPALLARWRWLGCKIRWALEPDEPRLLRQYLDAAQQAHQSQQIDAWNCHAHCVKLLHATARDLVLPWHWRVQCLDLLIWPMAELDRLAGNDAARQFALRVLRTQLAQTDMAPSLSLD